jgi:hypothetical protein
MCRPNADPYLYHSVRFPSEIFTETKVELDHLEFLFHLLALIVRKTTIEKILSKLIIKWSILKYNYLQLQLFHFKLLN